jgi:hypothetical protein
MSPNGTPELPDEREIVFRVLYQRFNQERSKGGKTGRTWEKFSAGGFIIFYERLRHAGVL